MKLAVIGGGAAGMAAALGAAENGADVTLVERQARLGKKLSVTGNGRCNLSNLHADPARYHGEDSGFVKHALQAFSVEETLRRFDRMGLMTVTEPDGRVYPLSDSALSVVDVLRFAVAAAGADVRTDLEIREIRRRDDGFCIIGAESMLRFDRVVVACGGPAGRRAGGTDAGIRLLEQLGHRKTRLTASLVQLKCDSEFPKSLKGIRAQADVRLQTGKDTVATSTGEVQFTDYGLSGPAIFDVSREAARKAGRCTVVLDLVPPLTVSDLSGRIRRACSQRPKAQVEECFVGILQNRLGKMTVKAAGIPFSTTLGSLTAKETERLAVQAKNFAFPVVGDTGFDGAQVTAGGIRTAEFRAETMESKLVPGLYACGEVLDIDGDCGGFNLQWAWSSGFLAGSCAAGGGSC